MIERSVNWLAGRLHAESALRKALRKAFPDHWSFMLGEIALYCFLILVATGVFLGVPFDPSDARVVYRGPYAPLAGTSISAAYASILHISFDVRAGLLVRQMHHWAALLFTIAIVVHMMRIFFTGAFRKPREINWMVGLTLFVLALATGFTGYSLPDDLLSGTGLKITEGIVLSIPLVGPLLAQAIFGGPFPNGVFESRLFFVHVVLLPLAIFAAIGAHLTILWAQKHSQFPGPRRTEHNVVGSPLWPNYALKSTGLLCAVAAVLALLGGCVQINPVWIYGPYEAWQAAAPAQPDWFVGWLEGALRIGPGPFWSAVVAPLAGFLFWYAYPFFEAALIKDHRAHQLLDRPRAAPLRTALGTAVFSFVAVLFCAGSDDLQAYVFHTPVERLVIVYRCLLVIVPAALGFTAYRLCRELNERTDALHHVLLTRGASGGYEERPLIR